jgi:hypothetical protein
MADPRPNSARWKVDRSDRGATKVKERRERPLHCRAWGQRSGRLLWPVNHGETADESKKAGFQDCLLISSKAQWPSGRRTA